MEIQKNDIKKSGTNKFAKYDYYTLKDILPAINKADKNNKICSVFNIKKEYDENGKVTDKTAVLTVFNSEDVDDFIEFETEYIKATLKGSTDIQCLGGTISYIWRYLLLIAYNISDGDDIVDATQPTIKNIVSFQQIKDIKELIKKSSVPEDQVLSYVKKQWNKNALNDLNVDEYVVLYDMVQERIPKKDKKEETKELESLLDGKKK